eukprot:CAMPEP_0169237424 /NCGR_PEP_ID=MMETSP1016-20121227/29798_1 /TAXON_ID=342587 /ORGANISM="Karlodinium micrum, Strain CCMP2283" /LENGTH=571 /DNA_ID=CAMNT_0009317145 /DNA_START=73 /DNA_END=1789 /DNA_ORIENTATION=+
MSPSVDDISLETQRHQAVNVVRMRSASPPPTPIVPLMSGSMQVTNLPLRRLSHSPTGGGQTARASSASFLAGLGQEPQLVVQPGGLTLLSSASARFVRAVSPTVVRYRSTSPSRFIVSPRSAAVSGGASPPTCSVFLVNSGLPTRMSSSRRSPSPSPKVSLLAPCGNDKLVANGILTTSSGSSVSARMRSIAKQAFDTATPSVERHLRHRRPTNSQFSSKAVRITSQPAMTGSSTTTTASSGSMAAPPGGPAPSPKLGLRKNHQAPQLTHYIDPLLARTPLSGPKGKKLGVSVLANRLRSVGSSCDPSFDDAASSASSDWRNDLRPLGTQVHAPLTAVAVASSSTTASSITGNAVASSSAPAACLRMPSANALHHNPPTQSPPMMCRLPIEACRNAEFIPRPRMHSASEASLTSEHSPLLSYAEIGSPPRSARAMMAKPVVVVAGSTSHTPIRQNIENIQACGQESEYAVESDTRPPSSERGEAPSGEYTPPISARTRPLDAQGLKASSSTPPPHACQIPEAVNVEVENEVVVDSLPDRRLAGASLWQPPEAETTVRRWWQVNDRNRGETD